MLTDLYILWLSNDIKIAVQKSQLRRLILESGLVRSHPISIQSVRHGVPNRKKCVTWLEKNKKINKNKFVRCAIPEYFKVIIKSQL